MSLDPRRRPAQQPPPPPPPAAIPDSTAMKVEVVPERPATTTPSNESRDDGFKLKFCTVCASNNNRYVCFLLAALDVLVVRVYRNEIHAIENLRVACSL